jgi:hypothetical protein
VKTDFIGKKKTNSGEGNEDEVEAVEKRPLLPKAENYRSGDQISEHCQKDK